MPRSIIALLLLALPAPAPAGALAAAGEQDRLSNWPQWRGPNSDGLSPQGDPPVEWSETKNVRWRVEVPGSGSATPVIWGEKLFVLTAIDTGRKAPGGDKVPEPPAAGRGMSVPSPGTIHKYDVMCLDRMTGRIIWSRTAVEAMPHEGHHNTHGYASGSPATDGKILIASFGSRGIFCYDLDGNLKWEKDLGQMKIKVGFGEGVSPVLHGNSVVVNRDHEAGSFIVCLDGATGDERWKVSRDEGTTWATPLVVEHEGKTQVVVNGTKKVRSYDLASGNLIWECGGQTMNAIPTPFALEGRVYCMSGYRGNAVYAIKLSSKGDVSANPEQVAWKRTDAGPYVASPLLYDGLIYLTKERQGILFCVDARTGDLKFGPERLPEMDTVYASLLGAGGKVYISSREGTTVVLKAGPKYEVLATNKLSEPIDASPVAVGKQLYLRGSKSLYCIESR
jgi:outer membrane protein assembly factor BamB